MPDKRDMHQAKSHRNSKNKGQPGAGHNKARGQASVPGGPGTTMATDETQVLSPIPGAGKKNKSRR